MSRVKLTEYRAKSLILGEGYGGVPLTGDAMPSLSSDTKWVLKVDQGVKKRMKQGLVALGISPAEMPVFMDEWKGRGYSSFIAEPLFPHESGEEQYLSLERVRGGIRLLHAASGGIDIEEHPEQVTTLILSAEGSAKEAAAKTSLPEDFLKDLLVAFETNHFAFIEINPLVIRDGQAHLLDAAVLVDSAGQFSVRGAWNETDIAEKRAAHPAEARVAALQKTTPASLKLTVLNPDASLFFLLSGGGGSIVVADEAALKGAGNEIGNYGEYSGGPTHEETYLYAKEVIGLMLASKAGKKALVIAGGVANFTDIMQTFAGIIDALSESVAELQRQGVKVFVRRGGPNEKAGLAHMRTFLEEHGLLGSVYGSDQVITSAVDDAVDFMHD
jgi:ATP-citrate lyase beta-subunit